MLQHRNTTTCYHTRARIKEGTVLLRLPCDMARCVGLWRAGLLLLLACLVQRPASSFVGCPAVPRASRATVTRRSRPGVRTVRSAGEEVQDDSTAAAIPSSLDRSAPPAFIANNNVNLDGGFVVCDEGEPTAEELANDNLIKIVAQECTDEQVNTLLWKCLGYRYDAETDGWTADKVFPLWKKRYPSPPDLVGVTRVYEREVDKPVMQAVQSLVRSVPLEHKRGIMEQLKPIGFTGFKLNELTPNRTRRAQAANFIVYFRESLWGVSLEELRRRRQKTAETEARKPLLSTEETTEG